MSDAYSKAFFQLHRDLPREGPGEDADVAWAAEVAGIRRTARICDAACGPGADIAALRRAAPGGHVTAMDTTAHFVAQARVRPGADAAVDLSVGSMAEITGPFDLIWCAGALYFLGVTEGLQTWAPALAPGAEGALAQVLEEARREASVWRAHSDSFGYLLSVVRPVGL